ncbi:uncharacterized protein LMH87_007546 [Akanthomyces muscarius]|uniref:Uncharacterized protein n=1 Tax=Akanthomyces muscarius TaxID=2231603 RepID=A0A9W8QMR6_AKAMU|nr:uncharacterized protein LMH87_007546 [Akanthomyces muscarius]KAJ4161508.1 hypothetical protein LMH87_007546 [Akanthomyces muscarius]
MAKAIAAAAATAATKRTNFGEFLFLLSYDVLPGSLRRHDILDDFLRLCRSRLPEARHYCDHLTRQGHGTNTPRSNTYPPHRVNNTHEKLQPARKYVGRS